MAGFHGEAAGNKLMMKRLKCRLIAVRFTPGEKTETENRKHQPAVDFVKGHPILYFILVTVEQHFGVPFEIANDFAASPTAVLLSFVSITS